MRMLNSLPPEKRCSQKGLALDLSLCSQKQDLACFLSWQGTRSIPTSRAGHVNIAYSILPHPQGSRQHLWILQVHSALLLPLPGQVLGSGSEYPTDLLDMGRDGTGEDEEEPILPGGTHTLRAEPSAAFNHWCQGSSTNDTS